MFCPNSKIKQRKPRKTNKTISLGTFITLDYANLGHRINHTGLNGSERLNCCHASQHDPAQVSPRNVCLIPDDATYCSPALGSTLCCLAITVVHLRVSKYRKVSLISMAYHKSHSREHNSYQKLKILLRFGLLLTSDVVGFCSVTGRCVWHTEGEYWRKSVTWEDCRASYTNLQHF